MMRNREVLAQQDRLHMSDSYYRATVGSLAPRYAALRGERSARTCIVGGGFAGLNTALGLLERGDSDCAVLESEQVGFGASGRNGGFVFAGFSRGPELLLADLGPERARHLYQGTVDAVGLIRQRCAKYAIDCDVVDSGVLWASWFRDAASMRAHAQLLAERFDQHWSWVDRAELQDKLVTSRYYGALFERNALHFNPLKYAQGLAEICVRGGVGVYESSPAIDLRRDGRGWMVRTPEGSVRAENVVLACGGYLAGLQPRVDAGVLPIATYVMVTEPLHDRMESVMRTRAAVYDSRFAFDYYRPLPDSRLLWGGRISIRDRSPNQVRQILTRDLLKVYPQLRGVRIEHAWSGLMSYARHQMPQIARIDQGLWVAQAFGGHGVAPTTLAGERLAAAIAEGSPAWQQFQPYGLVSAMKPAGFLGAQLSYWWLQAKDAWREARGG